jgi:hypothetical protein
LAVRDCPVPALEPATDGSLLKDAAELADAAGPPSFFWAPLPLLPADLPEAEDPDLLPDGLLTLWGLADVPEVPPETFPGSDGWRTARGPVEAPVAPPARPASRANPVAPSFRSKTCLPESGWTEILFPDGLRFGDLLVIVILLFRPLRSLLFRAFRAMCGSLSASRRTTVMACEL